jgi:hypothetical protein
MGTTVRSFSFGASLIIALVFGGGVHAADVYGWLFAQNGQPMPGESVQLTCDAASPFDANTDGQGFYQFDNVPTGICQLIHTRTNQSRQVYVEPGRSRHDLRL